MPGCIKTSYTCPLLFEHFTLEIDSGLECMDIHVLYTKQVLFKVIIPTKASYLVKEHILSLFHECYHQNNVVIIMR